MWYLAIFLSLLRLPPHVPRSFHSNFSISLNLIMPRGVFQTLRPHYVSMEFQLSFPGSVYVLCLMVFYLRLPCCLIVPSIEFSVYSFATTFLTASGFFKWLDRLYNIRWRLRWTSHRNQAAFSLLLTNVLVSPQLTYFWNASFTCQSRIQISVSHFPSNASLLFKLLHLLNVYIYSLYLANLQPLSHLPLCLGGPLVFFSSQPSKQPLPRILYS